MVRRAVARRIWRGPPRAKSRPASSPSASPKSSTCRSARASATILRRQLHGKPVQDVDFDYLARKTDGFSGADLKGVVDVAVEHKLREAMRAGAPKPITGKELLAAAAGLRPSTKEWFATAK